MFRTNTTAPLFGAPAAAPFGTTTTAAPQPTLFGAPPPTTTAPPLFGVQPAAPAPTLFGQAAAATTAQGVFGATTQATVAPLAFGVQPAATTVAPLFGAPAAAPAPAVGLFGAPTATTAPSLGLFGQAAPAATSTAPLFGAPAASTAPTLGMFGVPAAAATTAPSLFTTTTTRAPTLGFVGAPAATAAAPTLFGPVTAPATAPAPSIFAAVTTTITQPLFGTAGTTTVPTLGLLGTAKPAAPTSRGLGGVDSLSGGSGARPDTSIVKEQAMPAEIVANAETFKKYMKEECNKAADVKRASSRAMHETAADADTLRRQLQAIQANIASNGVLVSRLKKQATEELKNVEAARHNNDFPSGASYGILAPSEYFAGMVREFEGRMNTCSQQIDQLQRHLSDERDISPGELAVFMKRVNETFRAFAAQLQEVHEAIKVLKQQHLSWRRSVLGDSVDIFAAHRKVSAVGEGRRGGDAVTGRSCGLARDVGMAGPSGFRDQPTGLNMSQAAAAPVGFAQTTATFATIAPLATPAAPSFGLAGGGTLGASPFGSQVPAVAGPPMFGAANTSIQLGHPPPTRTSKKGRR